MGIAPFELAPQHKSIPNLIKTQSMANIVYLIKHNPSQGKKSHRSIIVDLAGESNAKQIQGLLLYAIVDRPVQSVSSVTKFDHVTQVVEKSQIEYRIIGQFESSAYLVDVHMIPNALKNLLVSDNQMIPDVFKDLLVTQFYANLCSMHRPPNERGNMYLIPLGEAVYHELIQRNSGIKCWSSVVNCQQYARLLIEFGFGLQWPDDVDVTGDIAPEIVNIGFFYQSLMTKCYDKSNNNTNQR
ncbi:unnamed protein product [Rotaria sp. Silwood2]|nr:unnamed protein product [Rotaria sp. Silwood2]CAF4598993.1 unnamed protein product [Rotaria sp. Silwood2]